MTGDSRQWFLLALVIGLGWLMYELAPIITPFAISAALAYMGDPLVDRFQRFRVFRWTINRTVAVVIVFLLMTLAVGLLLLFILPLAREQIVYLVRRTPEMVGWTMETALPWLQAKLGFGPVDMDLQKLTEAAKAYWKEVSSAVVSVLGTVSRGGQAVAHWLMNLVLIPVVTFYLLRDWDNLVQGIQNLIPRQDEPAVSALFREVDDVLGAFIRGQLMVMLALGLIYTLGLWLLGLDLAFIIGMGAGLLSIVPYLGTIVGVGAALLAAVFQFQDVLHPALVMAVFAAGQSIESMVLTPKLVGDRVGLHPVAVIFAVLAGGQLFGFLGILLALPVASALNVLVRHLNQRYRDSDLYRRDLREPGDT